MTQHVASIRTNILVFVVLLVLLLGTVGAAYLPLGALHFPIAMAIAGAKAVLIVLFFMHALHSHRLTLVICLASLLWLSIMLALTLSDYRTRTRSDHQSRGWVDIPGK